MIKHNISSHKGQNGKVCIVSGSRDYYGATILSALSCLKSGVDLVYLIIPECNRVITASYSPAFIIRSYENTFLCPENVGEIYRLEDQVDCFLIGPGLSRNEKTLATVKTLLNKIKKPIVLDADGLYALKDINTLDQISLQNNSVITPHRKELEIIMGEQLLRSRKDLEKTLINLSKKMNSTILLKGKEDLIIYKSKISHNKTGNESLTKGGTGDILAGLVAGFIAQKVDGFTSAKQATKILGQAGDKLFAKKKYNYIVEELLEEI